MVHGERLGRTPSERCALLVLSAVQSNQEQLSGRQNQLDIVAIGRDADPLYINCSVPLAVGDEGVDPSAGLWAHCF